jgi:hypothetical protein
MSSSRLILLARSGESMVDLALKVFSSELPSLWQLLPSKQRGRYFFLAGVAKRGAGKCYMGKYNYMEAVNDIN